MASSTVALATEATLFSVAGSITSKRPPSEDLRHLPPIHRSVGTLARRLSYMAMAVVLLRFHPAHPREHGNPDLLNAGSPLSRGRAKILTLHRALHSIDDALDRRQRHVCQNIGGGQRNVRRSDPHWRPIEVVERFIGDDRNNLGAPAAKPRVLLHREQPMGAGYRAEDGPGIERD